MQDEPTKLSLATNRFMRSNRHDAVRRARRIVREAEVSVDEAHDLQASALDAAFAELPRQPLPDAESPQDSPRIDSGLLDDLNRQLRRLDDERAHLSALLRRTES